MYEEFFNFAAAPFKLNPDPKFFFGSRSHNKAMAYLHYGLRQAEGFIVITGEIGAGKSMLIGHLLDQLDRSNVVAAHLLTPNLKSDDLISHILSAFRIEPANAGKTAEIEAFEDFLFDQLNRGRRVLLIVDEAQNLPKDTLEELRILSNMDYDGTPLFQVFLVGQPDFRPILAGPGMEQLRQRIIASYHLKPLNRQETQQYIEHRLSVVGWEGKPVFTVGAFDEIFEETGGVPRKINKLCNRLLLSCSMEGQDNVDTTLTNSVIKDLSSEDVSVEPVLDDSEEFADYPPNVSQFMSDELETLKAELVNGGKDELPISENETLAEPSEGNQSNQKDIRVIVPFAPVTRVEDKAHEHDGGSPELKLENEALNLENGTVSKEDTVMSNDVEIDKVGGAQNDDAPRDGESLLDALKRRGKIGDNKSGKKDTGHSNRSAADTPKTHAVKAMPVEKKTDVQSTDALDETQSATIDDVADAIAAVGSSNQLATERAATELGHLEGINADAVVESSEDRASIATIPAKEEDPKGWRKAVVKSINETRVELKEAHSSVARVRRHLVEIERRRIERNVQINASLMRAENLLSEIRDRWQ